jgi:arginine/ornithine transport system substrate-binding protein
MPAVPFPELWEDVMLLLTLNKGGNNMRKFLILLIAGIVVLSGTIGHAGEKLKIATEGAYPPFNFVDPNGNLKGFDVDIANALCEAMNRECELMVQDWDGMIPGLLAKKYDAIVASMSITEKRKKAVNFTEPYYQAPPRFVAKKGSGLEITKEGLKGKNIGVQRAATYADYLKDTYGDIINIKYYDTVENHNLDLVAGRVDAVLAQSVFMSQWLDKPEGKDFQFYGDPILEKKYIGSGAGIAVRKEDTQLLGELNAALEQIIENGTHKKLSSKYFDFDIYKYE